MCMFKNSEMATVFDMWLRLDSITRHVLGFSLTQTIIINRQTRGFHTVRDM